MMELVIHRYAIKKFIITHCKNNNTDNTINNHNEVSMNEFDMTIDESMRRNATTQDM